MRGIIADIFRIFPCRRLFKMSGVSRDAPFGIQSLQWISGKLLPRLQINRLLWYQVSVLILTYFTYMTYHLTRKPISVVKSVLHRNCSGIVPPPGTDPGDETWCDWAPFNTNDANTLLGTLDSAFLFTYAGAMFVSGMIAERVDLRYFLSFGMLISAIFCYLFGVGKTANIHNISYYLLVQGGAGIAQTSGWPGTVAAVGRWCGSHRRGLVFGLWNSHTSIGNILGTLIAAEYVETDWALSFIYPALAMGVVAAIVFLFLPADPADVGLVVPGPPETSINRSRRSSTSTIEEAPAQVSVGNQTANLRQKRHSTVVQYDPEEVSESTSLLHRESSHSAISFSRAFAIPGVMEFSLSLFFAKLVSYTFLYWLPLYINTSTSLPAAQAGALSTLFDVGGALGAVLAGALADAAAAPASVCCAFYALCAPALLIYQRWGAISYGVNVVLLLIAGALVNGPYALITTAVSAQLGTQSNLVGNTQALATVTAIIDGTGSIGAAVGPMLAGVVSSGGDWSRVFYMLICCDVLALLLLLRITKKEFTKIRQQRRTGSPRLVRIE